MAEESFNIGLGVELDTNVDIQKKLNELSKSKKYHISVEYLDLSDNALKVLTNKLNNAQGLTLGIDAVKLNSKAISGLQNELNKHKLSLNFDLSNSSGNIQRQAQQLGQKSGDIVSTAFSNAIKGISHSMGDSFTPELNAAKNEIDKFVADIEKKKGKISSVAVNAKTVQLPKGENNISNSVVEADKAVINYINDVGESIQVTLRWKEVQNDLASGAEAASKAWVQDGITYRKVIEDNTKALKNFEEERKNAVAKATRNLTSEETKALDPNSNKPILSSDNIDKVKQQIDKVNTAIQNLNNSNQSTFTDAKIAVDGEIQALKDLVGQCQRAETAAQELRAKPIEVVQQETLEKVRKLESEIKGAGVTLKDLPISVEEMKNALSQAQLSGEELTKIMNALAVATAKFSSAKAETKAEANLSSLKNKISSELSKIEVLKNSSSQLKTFETEINGVTVSLETLTTQFKNVRNESDLSVAKATMQAFKDAASAAASATTQASSEYEKLLDKARNAKSSGNASSIDTEIKRIEAGYNKLNRLKITSPSLETNYNELLSLRNAMQGSDGEELVDYYIRWLEVLSSCKNEIEQINLQQQESHRLSVLNSKKESMISGIDAYLSKNSRIASGSKELYDQFIQLRNAIADAGDGSELTPLQNQLTSLKNQAKAAGLEGRTFFSELKNSASKVFNWFGATTVVMNTIRYIREAVTELKNLDDILTEINKTSDLTASQLKKLGETSFESASKYGKKASDYLTGVQEMYRAGYNNAQEMAELSVLAQAAGDIDVDTANDYLIATDAAYKYKGSVEQLTAALDGMNYVTNHNALSMADLAEATKIAASQSASSNIAIDQTTAAMGTMIATTRQGGSVAARAWKGILMNLQQVEGEVEDGDIIDADQLSKYEKACTALGVSLKEVKDGVLALRDPIEILKELSQAYTALDESDVRRTNLINAVGGKYRGNQLNALLENWDTYEKMLSEYSQGTGSAMDEAEKSANNLTGSLNKLSNTWVSTVNNIVDSDGLKFVVNSLNSILSLINSITGTLGTFGTIGLSAGLFAGLNNVGGDKMFSL